MIFFFAGRPSTLLQYSVKRSAVSTAVEPPVVKNTRFRSPGVIAAMRSARPAAGLLAVYQGEL